MARSLTGGLTPLVVEVLDDLVGARPLLRRHDEVDLAPTEAIQWPVADATRVERHLPKAIPPGHGGRLLLEGAHGLPALQARVAHGHIRLSRLRGLAKGTPRHGQSVRRDGQATHAGWAPC